MVDALFLETNMTGGIYQIRNLVNDKIYIGSSYILARRWEEHKKTLRGGYHCNCYLQNAWNKYGEENFVFEVLDEIDNDDELEQIEQWYLDNWKPQYNLSKYVNAPMRGRKHTKESRRKMSEGKLGEKGTFWGKHHTDESKNKISIALRGSKHYLWGKQIPDETKKKMSISHKGKSLTENQKRNLSEIKKGTGNPMSKMTEKEVKEMRILWRTGNYKQTELAKMFPVNKGGVWAIVHNHVWKYVE